MIFSRKGIPLGIFGVLSAIGYGWIAFTIERSQPALLLSVYSILFLLYSLQPRMKLSYVLGLGILFRLLFISHIPALSQDFYRFLWDGQLQALGISPYAHTPEFWMEQGLNFPLQAELFQGMGDLSASHYSNYPPLSQYLFWIAVSLFPKSLMGQLISLRSLLLLADLLLFFFGSKLLKLLKLAPERIAFYFLNPLIILELSGNLHFEGLMWSLFVVGLYYSFQTKRFGLSILAFAGAIVTKLLPLLVLPLYWQRLGWKKSLGVGISTATLCLLSSLPYWTAAGGWHYWESVQLWFNRFEFNGSIYRLVRWWGFEIYGYNIIRQLGKITPFLLIGVVAGVSLLANNRTQRSLIKNMLGVLTFYLLTATTVHPWYLTGLVVFGVFSGYCYPLLWSGSVVLSYLAYGPESVYENPWILSLEYFPVYGLLIYEIWKGPLGNQIMWRRSTSLELK